MADTFGTLSPRHSALGLLIYKGLLFAMFLAYPLPGEELKWKRAPSLPMQELGRRFAAKSDKMRRARTHPRASTSSKSTREKQPLAHAEVQKPANVYYEAPFPDRYLFFPSFAPSLRFPWKTLPLRTR